MKIRSTAFAQRPGKQFPIGGETLVIQGEPEPRDPDRPGWRLGGLGSPRPVCLVVCSSAPYFFAKPVFALLVGGTGSLLCVARCFQDIR